jgi:hypothetical protein
MKLLAVLALFTTGLQAQEISLVVEPATAEVEVDGTIQFRASLEDEDGAAVQGGTITWFARASEVASISEDGLVTAHSPGQATFVVRNDGGQTQTFTVVVPQLPAARILVSVDGGAVRAGESAALNVRVFTRLRDELLGEDVQYFVSHHHIANVDAAGRLYGREAGQTTLNVVSGNASAEITIEILPNEAVDYRIEQSADLTMTGAVVRLSVNGVSDDGDFLDGVRPAWVVGGTGAMIERDGAEGVFVAERPGVYRVTALVGEQAMKSTTIFVQQRTSPGEIELVGRGPASEHHSADTWAFEGVDGRDYAYIGTFAYDWMKAWDVTDPANPVLTDSVQVDARRINDVKIHPNNRLGIITREGASSRRNGIVLLDLSDPAHPVIASEYTETVTGGVHNVWIDGENDLIYAVHNGTSDIHIIDVSDVAQPMEVGRWGIQKQSKSLHDVIVQDGYAYLSYWNDGVVMLDVGAGTHGGTPREPQFVSQFEYPVPNNSHTAFRYGRYLFIGDEVFPPGWNVDEPIDASGYVHVVDYTDIENPVEVATYEVPGAGAHNFWIEDDLMYVGYYQAGLRVVDVSGELRGDLYAQGREVASLKMTDENTTVANWSMTFGAQIFKGNIFTSDANSGLWIAKYSVPELTP